MDVLGDLVVRDRRSSHLALIVHSSDRTISYRDLCTNAYKAGNVLRYLGVRAGSTVAVADGPTPHAVWAFLGAAQLGAVTRFVSPDGLESIGDARVVLVPASAEANVSVEPGTKLAVFGGPPEQVTTLHWEKELWSENPAVHPTVVDPTDDALAVSAERYSHGTLLDAASSVVSSTDLDAESRVVVRGSLRHPGVVAGGTVAPLLAGGTIVLDPGDDSTGDVAVTVGGDAPEPRFVDASTVF